jgi:hypothetical protein
LFALEHGDVDRAAGVVQIRRAYANGRVRHTKTRLSRRAVPLQAIAVEALDKLRSRRDSLLVFPNARGGHLDFRNFNRRHWKPVQRAAGSRLLDALALERAVDAGWTSNWRPVRPGSDSVSRHRGRRSRRVVDARWTSKSEAITTSAARKAD